MNLHIPNDAVGITLYRIHGEELLACESVEFTAGAAGVHTVLRRAAISGRVDVGGSIENHFADLEDADGNIIETVALDADSYRALKNRWMRCKLSL